MCKGGISTHNILWMVSPVFGESMSPRIRLKFMIRTAEVARWLACHFVWRFHEDFRENSLPEILQHIPPEGCVTARVSLPMRALWKLSLSLLTSPDRALLSELGLGILAKQGFEPVLNLFPGPFESKLEKGVVQVLIDPAKIQWRDKRGPWRLPHGFVTNAQRKL